MRMSPMLSVTRNFPSGSSAIDHGLVSRLVMLSTLDRGGTGWLRRIGLAGEGRLRLVRIVPGNLDLAQSCTAPDKSASTSGAGAINLMRGSIPATSLPMKSRLLPFQRLRASSKCLPPPYTIAVRLKTNLHSRNCCSLTIIRP